MHRPFAGFLMLIAACGGESSEPPSTQSPSEATAPAPIQEPAPETAPPEAASPETSPPEPAPTYAPTPGSIRIVAIGEAPLLASQTEACEALAARLGEGATFELASDEEAAAIETLMRNEDTPRPSTWFTSETVVGLAFHAPYNGNIGVGLRGHVVIHGESMRPRFRYRANVSDHNRRNMFSAAGRGDSLAAIVGFVRDGSEG